MNTNSPASAMNSDNGSNGESAGNDFSSAYWKNAFSGTPTAIFVPPYIRFLQGSITLRKALQFLETSRALALTGVSPLNALLRSIEDSPESKQAEKSFETLFASALLINLVSEVEHFFVSCAATAICLYPGKIGNETFRLVDVLAATSSDELIERAANRALQSLMYEKPADYLSGLCEIVSIDRTQLSVYWPEFVELKARRDLGVHNNWIANEVYLRKLKEIDYSVLPPISTNLSPDFAYLNTALDSCGHLIGEMANLMAKKWLPKLEAQAHAKGSAHAEIPQSGNAS